MCSFSVSRPPHSNGRNWFCISHFWLSWWQAIKNPILRQTGLELNEVYGTLAMQLFQCGIKVPGIYNQAQNCNHDTTQTIAELMNSSAEYKTIYITGRIHRQWKLRGNLRRKLNESQGDHMGWVQLDEVVLKEVRWGGWTAWAVAKGDPRGTTRLESSRGSEVGEAGMREQRPKTM
jgi:hypothetical protein